MSGRVIFSGPKIILIPLFTQLTKDLIKKHGFIDDKLPEWLDGKSFKIELNDKEIKEWKEDLKDYKNKIMFKSFRLMNLKIDLVEGNKNVSSEKIQAASVE